MTDKSRDLTQLSLHKNKSRSARLSSRLITNFFRCVTFFTDHFLTTIAEPEEFTPSSSIRWIDKKFQQSSEKSCLSFDVYLSGSFERARVLVEKSDSSFDLKQEIKGAFNEWREVRFHLTLEHNETIYFEVKSLAAYLKSTNLRINFRQPK